MAWSARPTPPVTPRPRRRRAAKGPSPSASCARETTHRRAATSSSARWIARGPARASSAESSPSASSVHTSSLQAGASSVSAPRPAMPGPCPGSAPRRRRRGPEPHGRAAHARLLRFGFLSSDGLLQSNGGKPCTGDEEESNFCNTQGCSRLTALAVLVPLHVVCLGDGGRGGNFAGAQLWLRCQSGALECASSCPALYSFADQGDRLCRCWQPPPLLNIPNPQGVRLSHHL